jgi:hypothetical protein
VATLPENQQDNGQPSRLKWTDLHPALTATRRPAEWVDKAANPAKCLAALFLILERFSLKIEMGGKPF